MTEICSFILYEYNNCVVVLRELSNCYYYYTNISECRVHVVVALLPAERIVGTD